MRPYEIVIIFDASLEESVIREVVDRTTESVRARGGNPGKVDHWGKRRFAYQLDHRWEGYYVLIEATFPPEAVTEIGRMLTLADEVLRYKIVKIPDRVAGRVAPPSGARERTEAADEVPAVEVAS